MNGIDLSELVFRKTLFDVDLTQSGPFTIFESIPDVPYYLTSTQVEVVSYSELVDAPVIHVTNSNGAMTDAQSLGGIPVGGYVNILPSSPKAVQGSAINLVNDSAADAGEYQANVTVCGYYAA